MFLQKVILKKCNGFYESIPALDWLFVSRRCLNLKRFVCKHRSAEIWPHIEKYKKPILNVLLIKVPQRGGHDVTKKRYTFDKIHVCKSRGGGKREEREMMSRGSPLVFSLAIYVFLRLFKLASEDGTYLKMILT